jgi:hypothetical protein
MLAGAGAHLDRASAVFEAMLEGQAAQERAGILKQNTIGPQLELVRRFAVFTNQYPRRRAVQAQQRRPAFTDRPVPDPATIDL